LYADDHVCLGDRFSSKVFMSPTVQSKLAGDITFFTAVRSSGRPFVLWTR